MYSALRFAGVKHRNKPDSSRPLTPRPLDYGGALEQKALNLKLLPKGPSTIIVGIWASKVYTIPVLGPFGFWTS